MTIEIKGAGGGKPKQPPPQQPPKESANTLQSSSKGQILDLLGYGPIKGLVDGYKSVLLDDTPLHNADGTSNFEGVQLDMRLGDPDQDVIPGFRAVMNPREINAEVLYETPIVRNLLNSDANAIIVTVRVPALVSTDVNTGDTNPAILPLAVHIRDGGGSWHTGVADTIRGKNTSPYERSYRINLRGNGPFSIRVLRGNKESGTQTLRDQLYWSYLTEVVDIRHSYPNCALAGITVDAKQFGNSLPSRKYLLDLSIIQVPSNYDPETRTYTGFWDGTFKSAWTDNPAWCFYDLATHPVIGAGIGEVNKWALYEIAKYCDELVDDGYGGLEPRFTCNTVFSSQEDAITALNTLASVFRGMLYWGAGAVEPVADMPGPVRRILSPADVVDGEFTYMGTALKERHSVAVVMWNDPDDGYISKPEMVEDPDSIELLGWRELRITAVACTSRGQARRLGLWALYSEKEETQTCSFKCSVKHFDLRPGEFIAVSDPYRAGARLGGRVVSAVGKEIILDHTPDALESGWLITLESTEGGLLQRTVESVSGTVLQLTQPVTGVANGASFALSSADVVPRIFRVSAVSEQSGNVFSVVTTEHNPNKYDQVERGLIVPEDSTSLLPVGRLLPPKNIGAEVFTYLAGGKSHQGLTIGWTAPVDDGRVERFVLDVKGPSDLSFRTVYTDDGVSFDLLDTAPGVWYLRVRSDSRTYGHSAWNETSIFSANLLAPIPPASLAFRSTAFTVTVLPVNRSQQLTGEFEFWRSNVPLALGDIESNATYLSQGFTFVDTGLKFNTIYYYYVRGVNAYGTSDWVAGNTSTTADVEDILEGLFDEANNGPLGEWFKDEIGKIDEIGGELGAINSHLETIDGIIQDIGGIPEFSLVIEYLKGSLVKFDGGIYSAKFDVPMGVLPTDPNYWELLGTFAGMNELVSALAIEVNRLTVEVNVHGDDIESLTSSQQTLLAQIVDVTSGIAANAAAISTVDAKVTLLDGKLTSAVERTDSIYAVIKPPMAGDQGALAGSVATMAGVLSVWSAIAGSELATAQRIDAVQAIVGENTTAIQTEVQARTDADTALGSRIDTVQATVGDNTTAIQTEVQARTDADTALGSRIDTVQATVGDNASAIQTVAQAQATTDGELSAMWGVKLQLNTRGEYVTAGVGLGIDNSSGVAQSRFIVQADQFIVQNGVEGAGQAAFAVVADQVVIRSAFIGDATITMAKIGGDLYSTNYVAGVSGWILKRNGQFEINSPVPGQGRVEINNKGMRVYDAQDRLRVKIGDLS